MGGGGGPVTGAPRGQGTRASNGPRVKQGPGHQCLGPLAQAEGGARAPAACVAALSRKGARPLKTRPLAPTALASSSSSSLLRHPQTLVPLISSSPSPPASASLSCLKRAGAALGAMVWSGGAGEGAGGQP